MRALSSERIPGEETGEFSGQFWDDVGERMREKEAELRVRFDPDLPLMLRLDGHKFSTLTRSCHKPYDPAVHVAMMRTAARVAEEFRPVACYVCSDEITLLFLPRSDSDRKEGKGVPFGGKAEKLVSLASGCASAAFTHYFQQEPPAGAEQPGIAYFDGRAFNVPDYREAALNICWRVADCQRNSRSGLGHHFLPRGSIQRQSSHKLASRVQELYGIDYHRHLPPWYRAGTLMKSCQRRRAGFNPITQQTTEVVRTFTGCVDMETVFATFNEQSSLSLADILPAVISLEMGDHPFVSLEDYLQLSQEYSPVSPKTFSRLA